MTKENPMRLLIGLIKIIRLPYSILAALYVLVGAYLSGNVKTLLSPHVFGAMAVISLVISFAFTVNDYCDVSSDSLIKPKRCIPSGLLSKRVAGIVAITLGLIAFGISLMLTPLLMAICLLLIGLSLFYSLYLKSTVLLGNATVALVNASVVIYGSLAKDKLI